MKSVDELSVKCVVKMCVLFQWAGVERRFLAASYRLSHPAYVRIRTNEMNNYPTGGNFSTGNDNRQELRYSMSYELSGRQLLKYNNNNNILKIIIQ